MFRPKIIRARKIQIITGSSTVPCKFDRLQGKKFATNVSHRPLGRSQVLVNISVFM